MTTGFTFFNQQKHICLRNSQNNCYGVFYKNLSDRNNSLNIKITTVYRRIRETTINESHNSHENTYDKVLF